VHKLFKNLVFWDHAPLDGGADNPPEIPCRILSFCSSQMVQAYEQKLAGKTGPVWCRFSL